MDCLGNPRRLLELAGHDERQNHHDNQCYQGERNGRAGFGGPHVPLKKKIKGESKNKEL